MDAKTLKNTRKRMGLGVAEMATYLGWPYRTYQDREAGVFAISEEAATQVVAAEKRLAECMQKVFVGIDEKLSQDFPHGFKSL